jgi:hypothetical protein
MLIWSGLIVLSGPIASTAAPTQGNKPNRTRSGCGETPPGQLDRAAQSAVNTGG